MRALLQKLCLAAGPCGHEGEVREIFLAEVRPYCDSVKVDRMGNAIATRSGTRASGPKIMISAHMDEVSVQVTSIEPTGMLKFEVLGLVDPRVLPARIVMLRVGGRRVSGVVGTVAPHLQAEQERSVVLPAAKLFLDCGFRSRQEAEEAGLQIGTMGVFKREFLELSEGRYLGSAMDNRVGIAVAIQVLRELSTAKIGATLHVVASSQEEVGMRGIRTASYAIQPDLAVPLDVAPQHPDMTTIQMGGGPVLRLMEQFGVLDGLIADADLAERIAETARAVKVPLQRLVRGGGLTEGSVIHLSREGIPTCPLQVPSRYSHTGAEIVDARDMEQMVRLVVTVVSGL